MHSETCHQAAGTFLTVGQTPKLLNLPPSGVLCYLVTMSRLVLEGRPVPPVLTEGQLVGADKLFPAKVLGSLGDHSRDVGGGEQVHLVTE